MYECRNCGSKDIIDLGFIGQLAPFFLKRVFNLEIGTVASENPVKRFIQAITAAPNRAISRIRRTYALVEIQACTTCTFIQTKHGFTDESLGQLYRDYRSDSYNRERIYYEPSYRKISGEVGSSSRETQTRIDGLTNWLQDKIVPQADFSMLDYGGADGRFLPRIAARKYVYEISDFSVSSGIVQIKSEAALESYDYVQLAHILEHVSGPLELVRKVSRWLRPGGWLYIEVPQDFSPEKVSRLVAGTYRGPVPIHEHVNLYTTNSIARLIQSAGLEAVSVETALMDFGWATTTIIRALGRKS
jgi:SAM-dependent methyltransferase